ncbi:PREDICTED: 46 kDa FK506-binding nuclear protein [Atta colombica]|uniref:46 kDa FK506-binding nuclear protein n=1 Tax=Atta colombica TaxID=520822 RepID=UPI00084C88F2|nr:PREDICTED: 46 kDa FK506-binding nuclear protein [Atta colombica]
MSSFWALILQPGNKYSQYVNESFRITMASLDITYASKTQLLNSFVKSRDGIPETHLRDRPIQVMMVHEQTRFLLCTLHKDKPWQVQLNVLVQKETVVTLSCNGGSYVHLTGHYRIDSEKAPFNPNWITTLSWHILDEKINELKNKGTCLEELTEYLNKYTTIKIEEKWIVSPYSIKKKQIQENRIPLQVLNLKRKNFMKDNNRTEETKRQEIKEKQQKAKVTEAKSKEKDPDKTKKNSKQQDVRIIKSGMKVQELRPGTGKIAEMGKYVTIYYVAYVKTGLMLEEFDRFEKLGFRFKLGAGFVIKGLDIGVLGMKIDEKRRLVIPSNMAYGDESYGLKVPPNSTVVYDVELKKVE